MTRNEMVILRLLEANENEYVSYEQITKALDGAGAPIKKGSIRSTISRLRKQLSEDCWIVSKRRVGFRYETTYDMPF